MTANDDGAAFRRLKAEKLRAQEARWRQLDALTPEQWQRLDAKFREMIADGDLPKTTRRKR